MKYFLILFITLQLNAQEGYVIYKNNAALKPSMQALKENDSVEYKRFKNFAELRKKMDRAVQQKLSFKNHEAICKPILREDDSYLLSQHKNNKGVFYVNLREDLNYQFKIKHLKKLKITNKPVTWEKKQVEKTILGYPCFKAVGKINTPQIPKEEYKIEAWFTPQIQAPFGPKGFSNLPGLILELKIANNHYIATEVDTTVSVSINEPAEGEKISKKEYQQFLDDKLNSLPKF